MNFTISNKYLNVRVNSMGAEINSLKKVNESTEYIWNADPTVWGRHAPILFPVVGRLKNDQYTYQGQRYFLGQHGFAREMEFRNLVHNPDTLIFELQENEDTLRDYPFHFSLQISYYLWRNILYNHFEVHNTGNKTILFSIGGHPGFTCPLQPKSERSDYYLEFEKPEKARSYILKSGGITTETKAVIQGRIIRITDDLFDEDALIFKHLESERISLKNAKGEALLHMHFPGFPYLGIWSKSRTSPYVCLEPWFGLADNADHNGNLKDKEGILSLEPEGVFRCEFGIEIV